MKLCLAGKQLTTPQQPNSKSEGNTPSTKSTIASKPATPSMRRTEPDGGEEPPLLSSAGKGEETWADQLRRQMRTLNLEEGESPLSRSQNNITHRSPKKSAQNTPQGTKRSGQSTPQSKSSITGTPQEKKNRSQRLNVPSTPQSHTPKKPTQNTPQAKLCDVHIVIPETPPLQIVDALESPISSDNEESHISISDTSFLETMPTCKNHSSVQGPCHICSADDHRLSQLTGEDSPSTATEDDTTCSSDLSGTASNLDNSCLNSSAMESDTDNSHSNLENGNCLDMSAQCMKTLCTPKNPKMDKFDSETCQLENLTRRLNLSGNNTSTPAINRTETRYVNFLAL